MIVSRVTDVYVVPRPLEFADMLQIYYATFLQWQQKRHVPKTSIVGTEAPVIHQPSYLHGLQTKTPKDTNGLRSVPKILIQNISTATNSASAELLLVSLRLAESQFRVCIRA